MKKYSKASNKRLDRFVTPHGEVVGVNADGDLCVFRADRKSDIGLVSISFTDEQWCKLRKQLSQLDWEYYTITYSLIRMLTAGYAVIKPNILKSVRVLVGRVYVKGSRVVVNYSGLRLATCNRRRGFTFIELVGFSDSLVTISLRGKRL